MVVITVEIISKEMILVAISIIGILVMEPLNNLMVEMMVMEQMIILIEEDEEAMEMDNNNKNGISIRNSK